ncbi:putative ribonuclease P protein subunit p40 [Talaromyces proteolyticus]|uniref:Ribonuclease P protein subunit p40 n=1 Tax=Talaromyces proteolyticus TaxID=1131652 RepID=A0AAD4KR86_9EURO|nr:putative ribonuclease P protein subunit p40 [Talaromyces proteolyticus]KAH8697504.1 putative ribonuclease P protein subunit p40 [Talaromyces proteolyticus]
MLDFSDDASAHEKAYFSVGSLPANVDLEHAPPRKAPFSTISKHAFVHTTELILPKDVYTAVWDSIRANIEPPKYAQVIMPLTSLLDGEFFNTFIKTGYALMVSEGRPGVDDVYSVQDGTLTLELNKERYERTGLTGKPVRSGGRKHAKERFVIELDLRQPSMLHGKKGFERIVWACKNVLNSSLTWLLLVDPSSSGSLDQAMRILQRHQPKLRNCRFSEIDHPPMYVPALSTNEIASAVSQNRLEDYCNDISEWLALVSLESPRIQVNDVIDRYLSRYSVPQSDTGQLQSLALVTLRWHGIMTSNWITRLLVALLSHAEDTRNWAALSATSFRRQPVENGDGYAVVTMPERTGPGSLRFLAWEFIGSTQRS